MTDKVSGEQPDSVPVPDGQERLATKSERSDVDERIEGFRSTLPDEPAPL
ncbi:MAG TPA: hypothetical protein VJQ56_01735 [Blastocatellia bacterium]|nr:hypothetical protein [Blastocatellia bacterium]